MSDVPATLIIKSLDTLKFPLDMMLVVIRELFNFGVRDVSTKRNRLIDKLKYTPKQETLTKKFGNLPIQYLKTKIQEDEELNLLENAHQRYSFNTEEESTTMIVDDPSTLPSSTSLSLGKKRRKTSILPSSTIDLDLDFEESQRF